MIQLTRMMRRYLLRLIFRLTVFLTVLFFYLTDKAHIRSVMTTTFLPGISPIRVLWLIFMVIMIQHSLRQISGALLVWLQQSIAMRQLSGQNLPDQAPLKPLKSISMSNKEAQS